MKAEITEKAPLTAGEIVALVHQRMAALCRVDSGEASPTEKAKLEGAYNELRQLLSDVTKGVRPA